MDLGRLLWRYDALAAIDGFLRLGVPLALISGELGRYRGYRGVRQLRALVPLGDARAESGPESALRLHWIEANLPPPVLQHWIYDDDGTPLYRLDIADPDARYAAEYDGDEFHSDAVDMVHDDVRRTWLREHRDWSVDPFRKNPVYTHPARVGDLLAAGHAEALRKLSLWTPRRRVL